VLSGRRKLRIFQFLNPLIWTKSITLFFHSSMATLSASASPPWPNPDPTTSPSSNPNPNFLPDQSQTLDFESLMPPQHKSPQQSLSPASSPPGLSPAAPPTLLHLAFNQDQACFSAATDNGFRIYNCNPFSEQFRREFDGGGIGHVEMLFRCNIIALVGGGPQPHFPPNKVMIWDDHEGCCIGDLSPRAAVRSVRLRRDRIIVAVEQRILVYNFLDLNLLHQIETYPNPKGLCAVSQLSDSLVLACPGLQKGQIRVEHYSQKKTKFISAHDSKIACLALTLDGQLIATASSKGTLIRIFDTVQGTILQEVCGVLLVFSSLNCLCFKLLLRSFNLYNLYDLTSSLNERFPLWSLQRVISKDCAGIE